MTSAIDDVGLGRSNAGSPLEVLRVFLKLGLTSFGGPVAHLGYFRREFVVTARLARRARLCRSGRALASSCRVRPAARPASPIGLMRAGYLGGLAAWAGFTLPSAAAMTAVRLWRGRAPRPRWRRAPAWPQARRGRHCRPGGHGDGAEPVSGPAARDDRRPVADPDRVCAGGMDADRRHPSRRPRRIASSAGRARTSPVAGADAPVSRRMGIVFAGLYFASARAVLRSGARGRGGAGRAPSIARGRWCSAAAMSCCRCFAPRWSIRGGSPTALSLPATAPPRPSRGRCSPLPPISARSPPSRRAELPGRRWRSLRSSRPDSCS